MRLETPTDHWNEVVIPNYLAYREDQGSILHFINLTNALVHHADWVFESTQHGLSDAAKNHKSVEKYKDALTKNCPAFGAVREVSNASKHFVRKPEKSKLRGASDIDSHAGAFSNEFSKDFDISHITVIEGKTAEKAEHDGIELVEMVLGMWREVHADFSTW